MRKNVLNEECYGQKQEMINKVFTVYSIKVYSNFDLFFSVNLGKSFYQILALTKLTFCHTLHILIL